MENKSRSTCVVCGKVRYHKYLKRINNLWICHISVNSADTNYIMLKGVYHSISKCSITYLNNTKEKINKEIENYNIALLTVDKDFDNELIELKKIVRPDLTKKLQ